MSAVAELVRAAESAREFSVDSSGITLRMRLPTQLHMRRLVGQAGNEIAAAQESILQAAIIGWSGVKSSSVVPGTDGDLSFDSGLVNHVLDAFPDAADAAFMAVIDRYAKRRAQAEAAAGN